MPISFTCPHCGHSMNVADQYAGQTGPCARCGQSITIPLPKAPGSAAAFGGPAPGNPYSGPTPGPATSGGSGGGKTVLIVVLAIVGILMLFCVGVPAVLLIPAIGGARDAARRVQCQNNLKQIALALHNYHDVYQSFPPAYTVDANGKKLHSWRTLILPFIEQQPLFQQIKLDEPWDSPANQAVASRIPSTYRCPSDSSFGTPSVFTNYVAVSGPGAILENQTPQKMHDIVDGMSNTVLVVEAAGSGIHWMEPRDMDFSTFVNQYGQPSAAGGHKGGGNVALADGSVRFLSQETQPQVRQALATRAGGEAVMLP